MGSNSITVTYSPWFLDDLFGRKILFCSWDIWFLMHLAIHLEIWRQDEYKYHTFTSLHREGMEEGAMDKAMDLLFIFVIGWVTELYIFCISHKCMTPYQIDLRTFLKIYFDTLIDWPWKWPQVKYIACTMLFENILVEVETIATKKL